MLFEIRAEGKTCSRLFVLVWKLVQVQVNKVDKLGLESATALGLPFRTFVCNLPVDMLTSPHFIHELVLYSTHQVRNRTLFCWGLGFP